MRQVIVGPRLIPVMLEGGTNQVHFIAHLALVQIGGIDISCIDQVLLGKEIFVC